MVHELLSFHSQHFYSFILFMKIQEKNVQKNSISFNLFGLLFISILFFLVLYSIFVHISIVPLSLRILDQAISVYEVVICDSQHRFFVMMSLFMTR